MITTLITLLIVGFGALVVLGVVLALFGLLFHAALGLAIFLLFKVAPILLIGWFVLWMLRPRRRVPADEDILV